MKVCHMTSAHESNDARIFRLECCSLAERGYEVYIVAQGEDRIDNGVNIVGVGKKPKSRLKRMLFFTRKVYRKAVKLNCDIYHLHDPELLTFAKKLKKQGKIVIFDSHENTLEQMDDKMWIPKVCRRLVSKIYREYATKVFYELDGLISVTPHIVDMLRRINPNTWQITNYPRLTEFSPVEKECGLRICFTGGIESQWNHDIAIKAIGKVPGARYELCGWPDEEYLKTLQGYSSWASVNYHGAVSYTEAVEIQKKSDIGLALLQPSNNTGGMLGTIGNTKLFEYMMAGLPVICTNFTLWQEILNKWDCGICVDPNDEDAVASAIVYLKDNPTVAIAMGMNGRKAVEEEFNWLTQEEQLIEMYEKIGGRV
ncbi:Glycosyltransferase involved in cell wall bisynthesis [Lachnospiraceae bacterium YSD2013]|nr:Glycosyltransferase involved in cell wall bisynthesis [Lachnospiraceae bacterium YSD2013]